MSKYLFKLNKKLGQGLATLKKVENRNIDELITDNITPNFIFLHFGLGTEVDFYTVKEFMTKLGIKEKYFILDIYPGYPHGFLKFKDINFAKTLVNHLENLKEIDNIQSGSNFKNSKLLQDLNINKKYFNRTIPLDFDGKYRNVFFFNTLLQPENMYCANGKVNTIPSAKRGIEQFKHLGLFYLRNILNEAEEKDLLNNIHKNKWENVENRRIQNYGHRYIYGSNNINIQDKQEELPNWIKYPIANIAGFNFPEFDQCTIYDFKPGDGLQLHSDSHSAFEEPIVIISLLSDIVMTFKNLDTREEFHVLVQKNSALIMTAEIRYLWAYSISPRKVDRIEHELSFRRRHISLIYRKSKEIPFCNCNYPQFCDYAKKQPKNVNLGELGVNFEKKYVKDVYNSIAEHFSHTRYKPWPKVKAFLDGLPKYSIVGDIGCGNGKYIFCTPELVMIGTDIAESFSVICKTKDNKTQTLVCDTTAIPFRTNSLDYAISIAVIHHLSTKDRRKKAIAELLRIIRPGGKCLIYVWAFEQEKKFGGKDVFVPWNNQPKYEHETKSSIEKDYDEKKNTIVYKRYYHLFEEGELDQLLKDVAKEFCYNIKIIDSFYDHENWCINVMKL